MSRPISPATWRLLIDLALQFRAQEPWKWMCEGDVFGLEHPETGETGFCVVRGAKDTQPGLTLYRGAAGRKTYEQSFYEDSGAEEAAPLQIRNCLSLSFSSYRHLPLADRKLHQSLNLDRNSLSPLFRDHSDGWQPWPIEDEHQAHFLIHALSQSMELASRLKHNADLLTPPEWGPDWLLVRVPMARDLNRWEDEWRKGSTLSKREDGADANKLFLRSNCSNLPTKARSSWWIRVSSKKSIKGTPPARPYYPQQLLVRDSREKGFLLKRTTSPTVLRKKLQVWIKDLVRKKGYKPEVLFAENQETYVLLEKIAVSLEIRLKTAWEQPSLRRLGHIGLAHGQ